MAFTIKAYYKNELADLYGISTDLFREWLRPFVDDKRLDLTPKQKVLKPYQVEKIIAFLGEPSTAD